MKKRVLAVLMAVMMLVALCAVGGCKNKETDEERMVKAIVHICDDYDISPSSLTFVSGSVDDSDLESEGFYMCYAKVVKGYYIYYYEAHYYPEDGRITYSNMTYYSDYLGYKYKDTDSLDIDAINTMLDNYRED